MVSGMDMETWRGPMIVSKRKKLWRKVPGIIRHDFVRKLLALLLALIVYAAVTDKMGVERDIHNVAVDIPAVLTLPGAPNPVTLLKIEGRNPKVKIRVRGSERILKNLSDYDFTIPGPVFKPEGYVPGAPYQLHLSPSDVKGPSRVQILSVEPEVLPVDFDVQEVKSVRIRAVFDPGSPLPEGYAVRKVAFSPQEVRVTGPRLALAKLKSLQTKPIPLAGITQSFDYSAEVADSLPGLKVSPERVFVQIDVAQNKSLTFSLLPLRMLDDSRKNDCEFLSSSRVDVTLSGPKDQLALLKQEDVKPYIDISSLKQPGIYNVNVEIGYGVKNNAFRIVKIQPSNIKVKISKR